MKATLEKTRASTAAAAARVTIARLTPRTRSAGRPMSTPTGATASAARSRDSGKGTPRESMRWLRMNAPIPAKVICASDTCPTYPVSTTSDRHRQVATSDAMKAARNDPCRTRRAATSRTRHTGTWRPDGRPTLRRVPPAACAAPGADPFGAQRHRDQDDEEGDSVGQALLWQPRIDRLKFYGTDCTTPSPSPAAAVHQNEVKRPSSAAPRAGTTKRVYEAGERAEIGVMSTPDSAARTLAST